MAVTKAAMNHLNRNMTFKYELSRYINILYVAIDVSDILYKHGLHIFSNNCHQTLCENTLDSEFTPVAAIPYDA